MKSEDTRGWTTQAELDFIDQLASKANGVDLLNRYQEGMKRRSVFCQINPVVALRHAAERVAALLKKQPR